MEPWRTFYEPLFDSPEKCHAFVSACEAKAPPDLAAKIIMHQAQRLISLADDLPTIRRGHEPLRLFVLIMCAENVSKLHCDFTGEGQSRHHVRRFFSEFLSDTDKRTLGIAFTNEDHDLLPYLTFDEAVDLLYDLRCDVVHEGNYSDFAFHDGTTPMLNTDPNVTANISFALVRDIVARGCITAAQSRL